LPITGSMIPYYPNCTCSLCNPFSWGYEDTNGTTETVFAPHSVRYIQIAPQPSDIGFELERFETLTERRARWSREAAREGARRGRRRVLGPCPGRTRERAHCGRAVDLSGAWRVRSV